MIASLYNDTGNALVRLANAAIREDRKVTFTADADWEVTHYGVMETVGGPSLLDVLREPVTVREGDSLTLDLKSVTYQFIKLDLDWPEVIGAG